MSPIPLGILAVAGSAPAGAYELISTQVIGGEAVSVTFSSIPQTYKHLQVRGVVRLGGFNASAGFNMRLNNDSTSNYWHHRLRGAGSGVVSDQAGSLQTRISFFNAPAANAASGIYSCFVIDILDYASTSKTTTVRYFGRPTIGTSTAAVSLISGLYNSTAAISSMTFGNFIDDGNIVSGSRFSIYGIKGE
jgi:hypothetical protein